MNKEKIIEMVDRNIIKSLSDGNDIQHVKDELNTKMHNFASRIKENNKGIDLLSILKDHPDKITSSRVKYQVIYIQHCMKRIKDLDWVVDSRMRFPNLNKNQIFSLIKLKEKLSIDNSELLPF